jgi:hypothetical protein
MSNNVLIAEWYLNDYVLITEAKMIGTNIVNLECKSWGDGKHLINLTCTIVGNKLYHRTGCHINGKWYEPGYRFYAGNADKVVSDLQHQFDRHNWALWRSMVWEYKHMTNKPLIVGARLRMTSRELANPDHDVIVGCNLTLLDYDLHEMGTFCSWVDGKLYWSLSTDRPQKLFEAINMDEVTEILNIQAAEWAETHG